MHFYLAKLLSKTYEQYKFSKRFKNAHGGICPHLNITLCRIRVPH